MKQYKCIMPLEVRASSEKSPQEYIIKGFGAVPNSPEIYGHIKDRKTGAITRTFKSLFTDNAIASMNKQAKSKKVFVDAEHKTGIGINIKHYLDKLNISKEDKEQILKEISITDLPLAKVREVNIDDDGRLIFDIRMNPSYREINQKYFDAVWNSLQEGFIDGLSTTFVPTKVIEKDGLQMIDDVDFYGVEFTGGASSPNTQIFEVSMRAAQEFSELEARKMDEEIERREKALKERELALAEKEARIKEVEEAKKQESLKKEMEEAKKLKEDLQKELEAAKKARESGSSKQIVPQEGEQMTPNDNLEAFKYQNEIHKNLVENLKTSKNKNGTITFGQLLAMDYELGEDGKRTFAQARHSNLEPTARANLAGAHIQIQREKRVL